MSDSRTSNSIRNIFASIGFQVLNLVLSFINRTIFIQVLGVGFLGISGLFNDVLSMLNLAELGFGTAMTFSMYKPLAEHDYDTLAGLTNFYKKVYYLIASVISVIGVLLIPFLPYLINLEQNIDHVTLYYLLFLASDIASYLVVAKTTVMYADQKNYILIKYNSYWKIAQAIVLPLSLLLTKSYATYLVLQVLFVYGSNFHQSYAAQKQYPFIRKKVKLPKEKTRGIFKDVGSAFLYKVSNILLLATDNTLISILVSTEMVGYYSNYRLLITKLAGIIGTIFYSLIASLGNLIAKENSEKRHSIFVIMQTTCAILCTFCTSCLLLLEDDFIRVWLGKEFLLSPLALIAIVLNFYLVIVLTPVTTFREAAGLFRKTKFIMIWTAILNIVLSVILGKSIGMAGILLATSISKLLTLFWYEPVLLYRDFFKKSYWLYFAGQLRIFAILIVTVIAAHLASFWLIPESFISLIGKGIIVASVSALMVFLLYRKSEGYRLIKVKVTSMIHKN